MGYSKVFEDMIDRALLDMHTAFLGKVLSINGNKATVQPLGLYKQYGETAQNQAVVSAVISKSGQCKMTGNETISYISDVTCEVKKNKEETVVTDVSIKKTTSTKSIPVFSNLEAGNIVICVCCDRDISAAKNGINAVPAVGHHSLSDSVIVGIL